jgi:hypothetical protein
VNFIRIGNQANKNRKKSWRFIKVSSARKRTFCVQYAEEGVAAFNKRYWYSKSGLRRPDKFHRFEIRSFTRAFQAQNDDDNLAVFT